MTVLTMVHCLSALTLATRGHTQDPSPREQFQSAVAAYQKSATEETALKVIALFKRLDPAPAVPEEALMQFEQGSIAIRGAKDAAGAAKAVTLFEKAVDLAPWFAEAWYQRALARELEGQREQALSGLQIYLEFTLSETQRREVQLRIALIRTKGEITPDKPIEPAKTLRAHTQDPSPREQFRAAVAAYQKSATEETAQELAELFKKLDPPPAVPEEAEFRALKGAAFVKQAGDAAAFAKAAAEFQAAIAVAPWVGEYHYNLGVCQKSAGQFSAAQSALKFARVFARDDKERKDILALRADLEAAQELGAAKRAEEAKAAAAANTPQAREDALLRKVEGARFVHHDPALAAMGLVYDRVYEIKDKTLSLILKIHSLKIQDGQSVEGYNRPGEYLLDRLAFRDGSFTGIKKLGSTATGKLVMLTVTFTYSIRPDGQALVVQRNDGIAPVIALRR